MRKHSMTQHRQSLVQFEEHLGKNYTGYGLESLKKFRRWFRKLACFHKIQSTGLRLPKYLLQLIPTINHSYVLNKWNKLDEKINGEVILLI